MFEELDSEKRLKNDVIKKVNGGNTNLVARICGVKKTVRIKWITKMILLFNEGNMPKFDYTDKALIDRMIVVKHRSRFCPNKIDFEENSHREYTYMADTDMEEKLIMWRPYLMKWCLDGLNKYYLTRFENIPESCNILKKSIVSGQDIVKEYIDNYLIYTGDNKDYVVRIPMYNKFKDLYKEESDKKCALGKGKFLERLKQLLGIDNFRIDLKREIRSKDVFLKWKEKEL